MAKYVNLDEIKTDGAVSFTFKGVEHFMKEMSVGDLIDLQKGAQKSAEMQEDEKVTEKDMLDHFNRMIDMVCSKFSTFTPELANELSMDQLMAVVNLMTAGASGSTEEDSEVKKT